METSLVDIRLYDVLLVLSILKPGFVLDINLDRTHQQAGT